MGEIPEILRTNTATDAEREKNIRVARMSMLVALPCQAVLTFLAAWVVSIAFPELDGVVLWAAIGVGAMVIAAGPSYVIYRSAMARQLNVSAAAADHEREMTAEAQRRDFETRLGRALEMADDEAAAFDMIERAMTTVVPDRAVEMLLADNSHAHLDRVVVAAPDGSSAPMCPVDSPDQCVAARRAQIQVFPDSQDLDACPLLRGRSEGQCSGVCVPVSIMGRTVGVVHTTGPTDESLDVEILEKLQTLANQAGNRLGMLRVMAETQLQASTDGLTGLINRRSLENGVRQLRAAGTQFSFVMADLDHFKDLNDAFGHEAGDRALRIFSETLRHAMRSDDLACRYGGEEFAIVLPGTDAATASEIVERIREALVVATSRGDAPTFTASFGVAHSDDAVTTEELIHRADAALFLAKDAGRDCVCVDGQTMPVAPTLTALA